MTTMPFGKYKGFSLRQIPDDYLHWLLEEVDLRAWLQAAVESELHDREAHEYTDDNPPPTPSRYDCPDAAIAEEIIGMGLKVLAKRHHPDVNGGDGEIMKLINQCAEWLRAQIRRGDD